MPDLPAAHQWRHWRGVLFRVSPPQTSDAPPPVSYMLGTLHFGSLDELNLDAARLRDVLSSVQLFIDEVAAPPAQWTPELDAYRTLPAGQRLRDLLGAKPYDALAFLLRDLSAGQLQAMKPWTALALLESRGEVVSEHTLDRVLAQWAQDAGLPALHLETLDEQLRALDCVPAAEHAQVLRQRLATPWLFEEQAQRVLEYYRAGDLPAWLDEIDAMVGLDAHASRIEQQARLCLLEQRNARWMAQLDPLLRTRSTLIAVGAVHLTGDSGLLAGLHQRGYTIAVQPR